MEKKNKKSSKKTSTAPSKKTKTKVQEPKLFSEDSASTQKEGTEEIKKLAKIIVIITVIMALLYVVTMVATNKADEANEEKESQTEKTATEIQYEDIMIGTMLNKEGTYYVLIEEDGDNRVSEYETLIQTIKANEDAPQIYTANLTDSFNKNYLAKEENTKVDNIEDFKVAGTTLVKIIDKKIDSVYNNYDAIKNKLNELV